MKIGTDGVLLGAWTSIANNPGTILDIGAGTGILSLMLAQRSDAVTIDALEIEEEAYEQCVENFEASPWTDRLFCYHAGLDEFLDEIEDQYDLIVSNPPFYTEQVSSGNTNRDLARQHESLPFEELIEGASRLLCPTGVFTTVIPHKEEIKFIKLAKQHGLYPQQILRVKGNPAAAIKRSLLEFSFNKTAVLEDVLTIEIERHHYSQEYIALTKAFYLKM